MKSVNLGIMTLMNRNWKSTNCNEKVGLLIVQYYFIKICVKN